jgi:HAD superfamily hydrolase (TIGR01509 family)
MIRGVILDLDGTLVDSGLDFKLIRSEMGLPPGLPILEAIEALPEADRDRPWAILAKHESRGVEQSVLFPGVVEFLGELERRGLRSAVLTRNSRVSAISTLARFEIEVHAIHTRDDGPAKPDPSGIWRICEEWGIHPGECVMVGDYRFDIEAGRKAGTHTVLFVGGPKYSVLAEHEQADFTLFSYAEPAAFWKWLEARNEA